MIKLGFYFYKIQPQLFKLISQVLDISNYYLIKQSPDYKKVSLFASHLIWLFFKSTGKTVFRAFQLKLQEQYSRDNGYQV